MKSGKKLSIGIIALMIAITFYMEGQEKVYSENIKSGTHLMAIVIDDLGNDMDGTEAILKLDIPITVAVMPFLPSSTKDAEAAYQAGHEVIVHMPMEPNKGLKKWLGPGALTADLTDEEVRQKVEQAIDNIPHAVGMNNHMGSKITSNERIMRIVLQVCKERNLYYLDSKTTYQSVVAKVATELGVPYAENQLFLDDVYSAEHVHKQMQKAYALMERQENTVMIGHVGAPGKYTSSEILRSIPQFAQRGQLVRVSELILFNLIDPEVM
ncbi:divergent polysaccharide deacetylase family protein [Paenibacillus endoradicis]|uniref:divergent polysaccharide deacetylase family protein n=1 Tax=Paenibacillus endoradicis TaxID=2972487 RepID=UPI00358EC61C